MQGERAHELNRKGAQTELAVGGFTNCGQRRNEPVGMSVRATELRPELQKAALQITVRKPGPFAFLRENGFGIPFERIQNSPVPFEFADKTINERIQSRQRTRRHPVVAPTIVMGGGSQHGGLNLIPFLEQLP